MKVTLDLTQDGSYELVEGAESVQCASLDELLALVHEKTLEVEPSNENTTS